MERPAGTHPPNTEVEPVAAEVMDTTGDDTTGKTDNENNTVNSSTVVADPKGENETLLTTETVQPAQQAENQQPEAVPMATEESPLPSPPMPAPPTTTATTTPTPAPQSPTTPTPTPAPPSPERATRKSPPPPIPAFPTTTAAAPTPPSTPPPPTTTEAPTAPSGPPTTTPATPPSPSPPTGTNTPPPTATTTATATEPAKSPAQLSLEVQAAPLDEETPVVSTPAAAKVIPPTELDQSVHEDVTVASVQDGEEHQQQQETEQDPQDAQDPPPPGQVLMPPPPEAPKSRELAGIYGPLLRMKRKRQGDTVPVVRLPPKVIGGLRDQVVKTKQCNCKRSNCLKLYCDCFQSGIHCTAACNCLSCKNLPGTEYSESRTKAILVTLERNPHAFRPRLLSLSVGDEGAYGEGNYFSPQGRSGLTGCNCKKSFCLKKVRRTDRPSSASYKPLFFVFLHCTLSQTLIHSGPFCRIPFQPLSRVFVLLHPYFSL